MYWPLIVASTAGFSLHTLSSYAIGLFMAPLEAEFGWSRGSVAAGAVFDTFGDYDPLLIFGVIASFVCSALLFRLGRPPEWKPALAVQK